MNFEEYVRHLQVKYDYIAREAQRTEEHFSKTDARDCLHVSPEVFGKTLFRKTKERK